MHSLWRPDTVLPRRLGRVRRRPVLLDRRAGGVAVLGNAGGTIARAYGELWPNVEIDGVEIDPAVSEAGIKYLGLGDNPRLRGHDADARPFLGRTDAKYDLIVVDAYTSPTCRSTSRRGSSSSRPRPAAPTANSSRSTTSRPCPATGGSWTSSPARSRPCSVRPGVAPARFNDLIVGLTKRVGRDQLPEREGADLSSARAAPPGPLEPRRRRYRRARGRTSARRSSGSPTA